MSGKLNLEEKYRENEIEKERFFESAEPVSHRTKLAQIEYIRSIRDQIEEREAAFYLLANNSGNTTEERAPIMFDEVY